LVDYETLWVLAFSAVVISSGIFGLFSIAQNNPPLDEFAVGTLESIRA
jgi:hypothetical protein